jgi:DNA recombination protein RmuC
MIGRNNQLSFQMEIFTALGIGAFGAILGTVLCLLFFWGRERTELLRATTALHHALAHPTVRGQWGERMVEDVLKPVGFQEGVNYHRQCVVDGSSVRPDYSFLLPRSLKVNLDSKFPLDNYLALVRAESEVEKQDFKKRFLRDARERIKEVACKDYINPEDGTVDFVLVFIPNEQVYGFIHLHDPAIFDDALKSKVILCSPWTLYPVLSIIRLAIDNFILEKNTGTLLGLLRSFEKQWTAFNECLQKMGNRITDAKREFDQLVGTRQSQLDKVLSKVEVLRQRTGFHDGDGTE